MYVCMYIYIYIHVRVLCINTYITTPNNVYTNLLAGLISLYTCTNVLLLILCNVLLVLLQPPTCIILCNILLAPNNYYLYQCILAPPLDSL